ncbi:MAG: type I methionyl aminopeptidase [Candidatus Kapaibacteriales bacterium]
MGIFQRLYSQMIHYKNAEQIELMRESALLVSSTLAMLAGEIDEGVKTIHLDTLAEEFIRDNNARPGFKGLYDCPSTVLTSVNDQVVHGVPNEYELREGDIVSIDIGVVKNNYYGDHAYTFAIGEPSAEDELLMQSTKECLYLGIAQAYVGNRIGDISFAIQSHAHKNGLGVVEQLVGHGLGKRLHEEPNVPNFGKPGRGKVIKNGLVIAIEPMINLGKKHVVTLSDNFTIATKDGKRSAHYEHDVAVWDGKPNILSDFTCIEKVLEKRGLFYIKGNSIEEFFDMSVESKL